VQTAIPLNFYGILIQCPGSVSCGKSRHVG